MHDLRGGGLRLSGEEVRKTLGQTYPALRVTALIRTVTVGRARVCGLSFASYQQFQLGHPVIEFPRRFLS